MEYRLSHDERYNIKARLESELEARKIEPETWNIVCVLDHLGYLSSGSTLSDECPRGGFHEFIVLHDNRSVKECQKCNARKTTAAQPQEE